MFVVGALANDQITQALYVVFAQVQMLDKVYPEIDVVDFTFDISHERVEREEVHGQLGFVGQNLPKGGESVQQHQLVGLVQIVQLALVVSVGVVLYIFFLIVHGGNGDAPAGGRREVVKRGVSKKGGRNCPGPHEAGVGGDSRTTEIDVVVCL